MKKKILPWMLMLTSVAASAQNLPHLQPTDIYPMPTEAEMAEWESLNDQASNENADLPDNLWTRYEELSEHPVLDDLYSSHCSWYCGGEVKRVTASSHLPAQGRHKYLPQNAHDFDHESVWAEGVKGLGIGQWLDYEFAGSCPRITTIKVLPGHVKTPAAWQANSRPKQLKVYYLGKPLCILDLKDQRAMQYFDLKKQFGPLGFHDENKPAWHLRFEILEAYPGTKYEDTVIAELIFDGIDVH